ncbi:tetratricopeptide repeat protein [Candidatus Peregrinibacteria bacterium]|nr:tetratricopeptide repeat protein [Candidatus Peregrinibacteria bacterium]
MPTGILIGTFFTSLTGILFLFGNQSLKLRREEKIKIHEALKKSSHHDDHEAAVLPPPQKNEIDKLSPSYGSSFEQKVAELILEQMKSAMKDEGKGNEVALLFEETISFEKNPSSPPDVSPDGATKNVLLHGFFQNFQNFFKKIFSYKNWRKKTAEDEMSDAEEEARKKAALEHKRKKDPVIPRKEIHELLGKAEVFLARNELEEAEKLFIKILSFDEENVTALQKLAYLYLQTGSPHKSEGLYLELLELTSGSPAIYTNLGLALFNQKKFEESIEAYKKAVELDVDHGARYANLGQVYFVIQNLESAIECFENAVKKDPRNLGFLYHLADSCLEAKRFSEARKWYEKILDLSPYDESAKEEVRRLQALGF